MRIKAVAKYIGKSLTVDIEVNGSHTYQLDNGVIVHNTVSQVVDSASGCHPRFSEFYIRRYRISKADPLFKLMKSQGIKCKPEVGQTEENATTMVVEFPIKSSDKCITRKEMTSFDQLNWYMKLQKNWSTHNVSLTVYVQKNDWISVGNWVYDHFDDIVGISFLPYDDHKYELAPYEEIDEKTYNKLLKDFPEIDFTKLGEFEKITGDKTEVAKTYACTGDKCELV
jgi:ribonucleoside-diphosphate reductase alpha chain